MTQTVNEVLADLQNFVAGRGHDDNFCYSKVYSPSSLVRCVDFSPWVEQRLKNNDLFGLAVFKAQLSKDSSFGMSLEISVSNAGEVEIDDDDLVASFGDELKSQQEETKRIVQFPFNEYFSGDFELAKLDIITSWILSFSREQFARILTAYNISLNNAQSYLDRYNTEKKTHLQLPASLPNTIKFEEFRNEFRKLPLSSRLHLFDVLSYSGFDTEKPTLRLLSDMTLYDTRRLGIDEHESANILRKNKLIISFPDGTGYVDPEYVDVISMASEYAQGMASVYREWESDVFDRLFELEESDFDDMDDISEEGK